MIICIIGMKTVVNALLESIPALISVLLIVLLFLLVFGILGIQLFKGQLGVCNDEDDAIEMKADCRGEFLVPIFDYRGVQIGTMWQQREWSVPFNNYDDIFISMLTFFEIATLSGWPDMMFGAVDSYAIDHVPVEKNKPVVSFVYVFYIFLTTFFIMNMFISVIVDNFN